MKEDNSYFIDDKKENILNDPILFDLTSELIRSDYSLKYNSALKKYKQLITQENKKNDNEFLDW